MAKADYATTHWTDCWRERRHHDCAVARLERLLAIVEDLAKAPEVLANKPHSYLVELIERARVEVGTGGGDRG